MSQVDHPYRAAPATAFWKESVTHHFDAAALLDTHQALVTPADRVASAGSCFASNLVPYLERNGLNYLRLAPLHPALGPAAAERFGYANFSAGYGNIYTARQLLQLLRRSLGRFSPIEDRWHFKEGVIDPFRPGLRYPALNDREFDRLQAQHLGQVRSVFEQATVFVFTLGLTEAWFSADDGAVFPVCPGTVAGEFDPARHQFTNFSVAEVTADLCQFIDEVREINPELRVILTVSPVPLVATATQDHVLCASTYSKSVLRVAAQEATRARADVVYFPSYELVTGPQAPAGHFEQDKRSVSEHAVRHVMEAFIRCCDPNRSTPPVDIRPPPQSAESASQIISPAEAECEEMMLQLSIANSPQESGSKPSRNPEASPSA